MIASNILFSEFVKGPSNKNTKQLSLINLRVAYAQLRK